MYSSPNNIFKIERAVPLNLLLHTQINKDKYISWPSFGLEYDSAEGEVEKNWTLCGDTLWNWTFGNYLTE